LLDGDSEDELWTPDVEELEEYTWYEATIDLSNYMGQTITLAFKYEGDDAHAWYVDDVEVSVIPAPATVTQEIELVAGWNWVSFYVEADDLLEQLETSLGDHGISIQTFDDVADYFGDGIWSGLEGYELSNGEMVMVEVAEDCSIALTGTLVDASFVEITINPEWNWIGFPIATETAIEDAFAGFEPEFEDVIQNFDGTSDYLGVWSGDVETLVPGQGYLYYSMREEPTTLVFSVSSEAGRVVRLVGKKASGNSVRRASKGIGRTNNR
jgi:hypothetical protein